MQKKQCPEMNHFLDTPIPFPTRVKFILQNLRAVLLPL